MGRDSLSERALTGHCLCRLRLRLPHLSFRALTAPSEVLSFVVDPFITVPRNHTVDFTIQRELPGNMILELGYIGRMGRNLYQSLNLNQVPYNFKDPVSGQTFAQAFDALADQLRSGSCCGCGDTSTVV